MDRLVPHIPALVVLVAVGLATVSFADTPAAPPVKLPAKEHVRVFLLVGQSNMAGRGKLDNVDRTPHERVIMLTPEKTWAPALDPLHSDKKTAGVGLATTFARILADKYPEDTIALVPAAVGGTSIDEWATGGKLYTNAVARAKAALKDGTLAGILWHQGEADTGKAAAYTDKAKTLFADLRKDLDAPNVPIVVGTLGDFVTPGTKLNPILKKLPESIANLACADAAGLVDKGDKLHFDSPSYRELGKRYAAAFLTLTAPATTSAPAVPAKK